MPNLTSLPTGHYGVGSDVYTPDLWSLQPLPPLPPLPPPPPPPKYFWRLFQRSWALESLPFRLNSLLRYLLPIGWRVSFGFWMRFTVDGRRLSFKNVISNKKSLYQPLDDGEIRIVELLPGKGDERLEARLHHTLLAAEEYYEALSYTWLPPDTSDIVQVNGQTLEIRSNLADALRRLRRSTPRFIWIDTICINQSDSTEKGKQVSIMNSIFHSAEEVIIWLGEQHDYSDGGMEVIRYLTDQSVPRVAAPWYTARSESQAYGFVELLKRPWWERIWTVQEAALARKVRLICGEAQVTWATDFDSLRRIKFRIKSTAISPQWRESTFGNTDLRPLLETIESQLREAASNHRMQLQPDLLDVIYDFRWRRATDPRDLVYAILNLVEGRNVDLQVRPDYTVTAETAHEMLTRALDRQYGGLGVEPGI